MLMLGKYDAIPTVAVKNLAAAKKSTKARSA
jgi:hypothetical protein